MDILVCHPYTGTCSYRFLYPSTVTTPILLFLFSGTYNNEWMVLDYKKLKASPEDLDEDGVLTVLEQLPGKTIRKDQTEVFLLTNLICYFNYHTVT